MRKLGNGLASVSKYMLAFGPFGLFAVAVLDATFVPMPGGADAVMLLLSNARPSWWPVYAAAATLGSVVGSLVLYYISRRAGRSALSRFSESKQARVQELIERYDVFAVVVASLLPPPFPLKLFVVSAGVFRFSALRFGLAIAGGRALRFALEGYLVSRYGEQAKGLFAHYYPYVALGLAALVVIYVVARSLLKRGRGGEAGATAEQSGAADAGPRG
jgi:undecaprenyl-diphosphatase